MKYQVGDAYIGYTSKPRFGEKTIMTGTISKRSKEDGVNRYFVIWTYEDEGWGKRQAWYPEKDIDDYIKNIPLQKRQPLDEELFTI
jgi:hypothetical protein